MTGSLHHHPGSESSPSESASKEHLRWPWLRTIGSVALTVLMAAVLVFLVELIVRGSFSETVQFFSTFDMPGWSTILLLALLMIALDAVLGRAHQALIIVGPVILAMAFISHEKARYLGDPLYPVDFLYARQIVDLLPLLARDRPWMMATVVIGAILGLVLFVTALVVWRRRGMRLTPRGRILRLVVALPVLASFASIMDYSTFSWVRDRLQIIPMMWDQKENYSHNGFAAAFILNVPMADVAKPKGYSKKAIESIAAGPAISVPPDAPDIIIVMNESFWDATRLPNTKITPDPIPTVRANRSGYMFSPEFGGTTANIEFEALTGFSNAFLPYGSIPYQQYMRRPMPSLASFLGSQGYVTRALHPYAKWFWNRGTTYKDFGFDEFMSEESMPPLATRGPLVSDEAFFNEIKREADQQKRPFFFFAVTLQNHGPYEPFRYTDPALDVETSASDASKQSILSYAEGTHDGDKALASLMDWAQHRKRHTILVMFGDHLPPLGPAYVETGFLKDNVAPRSGPLDKMKMDHETPLVIWSNRSGPLRDVGTISPSLIPLYVLKLAGISHPYYTGFLSEVRDHYSVVYRQMLISADGEAVDNWQKKEPADPVLRDFRFIQYDEMFGKEYASPKFFPGGEASKPGS
ncbi:MAG: cation tolerance protein CutA [Rhizobiales bacterium 65-79]|nr:MAG: cation tolerance protein CutA [Rhizobiales bacterium 65-79]